MTELKTLAEAASDLIVEIETVGFHEAMGLEEVPEGRRVDREKCMCGAGCESPLECEFWYYVRKTEMMERKANRQVRVGRFRVDCLFDCDGQRVVVELDGKAYHDAKADMHRDDELLQSVDSVIRIPFAAMHFYPHATFCVLAEWYPRFQLRAVDVFCIPIRELKREMTAGINSNGDFVTAQQWLDWAEPNYELWGQFWDIGWVGSPQAWLKDWNVKPIMLRRKRDIGSPISDRGARAVAAEVVYQEERDEVRHKELP